jgi:hypothetical protein
MNDSIVAVRRQYQTDRAAKGARRTRLAPRVAVGTALVLTLAAGAHAGESAAYKADKKAGKARIYELCGFKPPRLPGYFFVEIGRAEMASLRANLNCLLLDQIRQEQHDANLSALASAFAALAAPPPKVQVDVTLKGGLR